IALSDWSPFADGRPGPPLEIFTVCGRRVIPSPVAFLDCWPFASHGFLLCKGSAHSLGSVPWTQARFHPPTERRPGVLRQDQFHPKRWEKDEEGAARSVLVFFLSFFREPQDRRPCRCRVDAGRGDLWPNGHDRQRVGGVEKESAAAIEKAGVSQLPPEREAHRLGRPAGEMTNRLGTVSQRLHKGVRPRDFSGS